MGGRKNSIPGSPAEGRSKASAIVLTMIIVLIILSFVACKKEKKAEPEKLVNVRIWPVEIRKVQPYLESTGTLRADEEVLVSSEVDGIVKKIYVEQGTIIHSGALLAEVRDTDYRWDATRSDAALKQTEASLANARAEFKRKESLFKEELITKQQFDDISTRVALAEAELDRAKATAAISRERLAKTRIYSPLAGAVKEKRVTEGDYVRNGTPIFQVIKTNPLKLNFTVSEKDVAGLKIGQEVAFTVDAIAGQTFTGKVSLLYPNVEERTRTLQAEALVQNAKGTLKPGFFARILIYTQAPREAVVAPLTALLYDAATVRIFVAEGNTARERIVKIGGKYGEYVEITEGLKAKEQVVVVGQNNLSEGVKLNVAR